MVLRVAGFAALLLLQIAAAPSPTPAPPPPAGVGPPSAEQPSSAADAPSTVHVPAPKAKTVRVCQGHDRTGCPPDLNQFFPCAATQKEMADTVCDVKKTHAEYLITPQGNRTGVQCPFTWFLVTCAWNE